MHGARDPTFLWGLQVDVARVWGTAFHTYDSIQKEIVHEEPERDVAEGRLGHDAQFGIFRRVCDYISRYAFRTLCPLTCV